jgi:DNA modification methylase
MGGGTTGAVAVALSRHFVGVEKDPATFEIAKQRIGQVKGKRSAN